LVDYFVLTPTVNKNSDWHGNTGWTDGLPIMPPTEEAVAEMLTGTDHPAETMIEKLEPHQGKATVEKIAINAVMAGCLPTYMPLLIASVHAVLACQE
jgi:hypothetical protein